MGEDDCVTVLDVFSWLPAKEISIEESLSDGGILPK